MVPKLAAKTRLRSVQTHLALISSEVDQTVARKQVEKSHKPSQNMRSRRRSQEMITAVSGTKSKIIAFQTLRKLKTSLKTNYLT